MRLNDGLSDVNKPASSEAQHLLKEVIDRVTLSLSIDPKSNIYDDDIYKISDEFFDKYYVKPDSSGAITGIETEFSISQIEAEIINFFLSPDSDAMPFIFADHAGRGKSTILKYISYYLFNKSEILSNRVRPIYISLRENEAVIHELKTVTSLHSYINKLVKESIFNVIRDYIRENLDAVLEWINSGFPSSLQSLYPESRRNKIECVDEFLADLRGSSEEELVSLIIGALCHYSKHKCPVVIFLDDADNFDIDTQKALLNYASRLIPLGIKILVSVRYSTWRSLEADRRDYEARISTMICWTLDQFKELIQARLDNAKTITLSSNKLKLDVSEKDVVNSFISLFENEYTANFLIKTSNFNLHILMRKLLMMPSSWHFNDRHLLRDQLIDQAKGDKKKGMPLWNAFNLILGCYRGTFQGSDSMVSNGLLNCFCTRDDKHAHYTFFVRLHFLSRLRKNDTDALAVPIRDIYEEYEAVFGENLGFTRVFNRTLYRLIQGGLLFTKSCRRYQGLYEVEEHINDDAVFISEAGLYYIDWLISRLDYLYFMKDDIDWPENCDLDSMTIAKVGENGFKRHKNTLKALKKLMKLELQMLRQITQKMGVPGDGKKAKQYINMFSASRLAHGQNEVLFTRLMLEKFESHLKYIYKQSVSDFDPEIDSIKNLLSDFGDVRSAFL